MDSKTLSSIKLFNCSIVMIICFSLVCETGCKNKKNVPGISRTSAEKPKSFLNWNVFFGASTNDASRGDIKSGIETFIREYVRKQDPAATVLFQWTTCPCDTLLANLDATLVGVSGDNLTPPPTQPRPGPSGDYSITSNIDIEIPEASDILHQNVFDSTYKIALNTMSPNGSYMPNNQILSIIDTGLDTTVFKTSIKNLLWKDSDKNTLFDFTKPDGRGPLSDSNKVKHGTSVTLIALTEITSTAKPRIMALKAFDKNGKGSIYSVSCALSYAIQNNATIINVSWGYYGKADSVLYSYLKKANKKGIPVIIAAGNTKEPPAHKPPLCTDSVNKGNYLIAQHLFYPACFTTILPNLVSVTGVSDINDKIIPCFYQNYSDSLVSVGVLNKNSNNCCQYKLGFLRSPIEGSSFATPVVSGRYLLRLEAVLPGTSGNANNVINSFSEKVLFPPFYTQKGRYISYMQRQ